ncbi:MAG TPA: SRPBCC family protein [Pyrinomonadaceae bacterium]|nr:SRPBCC family protein [Pyrinomonadaceae bacterium]
MFDVDRDITKAKTLASDFYTEPEWFLRSKESIFAKSWQFIGSVSEVNNLKPITLLEGFLDEPVLMSRTNGEIRCLSNVCTHRGKILVEEACSASLIRCGYHGRRFSLDGKFMSMPEFDGVVDFPGAADDLKQVPDGQWGELLFASANPLSTLDEWISDVSGKIEIERYVGAVLTGTKEYEVDAHWALYCENYLEGFHIPFVHKSLNEIVDYGSYATETFRYTSLQTGQEKGGGIAAQYLFVFPNMMFNFYPWGISVNVVRPVSPSKSVVEFLTYVSDESRLGTGAGADLDRVELEDEAVVASVQKGIRSRFYTHGRYSPTREQGTHHFHRLICEFMGA